MSKLSGRINQRYHVIRTIGRGGLTTVYKAFDIQEKRQVAIKVLASHLASDPTFKTRFEREIKILGQFDHPNIVPILDSGEYQGAPYLVMPFFSHGTLSDRLRSHPLSPEELSRLIDEIASALAYEHKHGIFHRDIKPSNILIDKDGKAYLSDFDLVHLSDTSQNLTGSAVIGTPAYMSPEQCKGGPVDSRSDQYSLAIVVYQLTTGHLPFYAETPIAIAVQQINEPLPSPSDFNPDFPESIEAVLSKALSKDPDRRYPSITAFNQAFQRALKISKITSIHQGNWAAKYYEITQGLSQIPSTAKAWFSGAIPRKRYALLAGLLLLLNVPFILFALWGSGSRSSEAQMQTTIAALYTEYSPREGTQQPPGYVETLVAGTVSALQMDSGVMAAGNPQLPFSNGESSLNLTASETSDADSADPTPIPTKTIRPSPSVTPTPTRRAVNTAVARSSPTSTPTPTHARSATQTATPTTRTFKICDDRGQPLSYDDMHLHRPYTRENGVGMTIHAIRIGGEETKVVLKKVVAKQDLQNVETLAVDFMEWSHWGMDTRRIPVNQQEHEIVILTDFDFYACYAAGMCDHSLYGGDIYIHYAGQLDGTYALAVEVFLPNYGETCRLNALITVTPE